MFRSRAARCTAEVPKPVGAKPVEAGAAPPFAGNTARSRR